MKLENQIELTPLERSIFEMYFKRFKLYALPSPSAIFVQSRKSTGSGRYTFIVHDGTTSAPDGKLGLGQYSQLNMTNLDYGASFYVYVKENKMIYLDISVNGDGDWDGTEGQWQICDPDTGE